MAHGTVTQEFTPVEMLVEKFTPDDSETLIEQAIAQFINDNERIPTLEELQAINPYREMGVIRQKDLLDAIAKANATVRPFIEATGYAKR